VFHLPDDPEFLSAYGRVSIRHAQLDYSLKLTLKSVSGVAVEEAIRATAFANSMSLRKRIQKLAKLRFGEGATLVRLQAILERCRQVTERRNRLIHGVVANNLERVDPHVRDHQGRAPLPTPAELNALANEIYAVCAELNDARLAGFLFQAFNRKAPPK
jgi:hypothetical protein